MTFSCKSFCYFSGVIWYKLLVLSANTNTLLEILILFSSSFNFIWKLFFIVLNLIDGIMLNKSFSILSIFVQDGGTLLDLKPKVSRRSSGLFLSSFKKNNTFQRFRLVTLSVYSINFINYNTSQYVRLYIYIMYIFMYIFMYILLVVYLITQEVHKWHSEENTFHIRSTNAIQIIIVNVV